jgi:hypothetical protein
MLNLIIKESELFNEADSTFVTEDSVELVLEHSLVSVSKWESITQKPFLTKDGKTPAEMRLYIEMMIVSPNPPENVVTRLSDENMRAINDYIESSESATTFGHTPKVRGRGETVTSELIYFWMVTYNIPFECQYWHLNRLLTLIKVCNIKTSKPKPMSKHQLIARNRDLNAKRRAEMGTRG